MANRLTSWWRNLTKRSWAGITAEEYIGMRTRARTDQTVVTPDTALRNSAVWAALRLRADLISTFPLDVFRKVGDARVEAPRPKVLIEPGGDDWDYHDWMYATQFDQDRCGNSFGLIAVKDGRDFPVVIEPLALGEVVVRYKDGKTTYKVGNTEYTRWTPNNKAGLIWHERQFPLAGTPLGLSPVAYAAWVISENISTQQFAQDWFSRGSVPAQHLKNTQETVLFEEADAIKQRFRTTISNGDLLVTGQEWEFHPLQAAQMGMEWLEGRKNGLTDITRFFGVPGDLIDAAVSGQSVTYANITERNLQFLIMNLGPAVIRREKNLSKLTQSPRFVKLNTNSLLRMDPKSKNEAYKIALDAGYMAQDEVRALEDMPPLTPEQIAQIKDLKATNKNPPEVAA